MELFKIINSPQRFFAISPRPRAESLESEYRQLKSEGVSAVVSLMEAHEEALYGLQDEEMVSHETGIRFFRYPMPDRAVPDDIESYTASVKRILDYLAAGESIVAHCVGGIGRSGLVALAVLLNRGADVSEALSAVSAARGREAPDTPVQIDWFKSNALRLRIET